jgi:long-subunit fatty acid transport protein
VHERFDIEVDFVFENWSSLQAFEVEIDAAIDEGNGSLTEMPDAEVPKRFRDTYSVRLGGDVEVWPEHLAVRLGGYYQSSAYPEDNSTFNVDFPFGEQFGLGGGVTWHTCKYLDVNVGYLHVFQPDVEVEGGVVQQQGLPLVLGDVEQVIGNTVNNGKYEVSANLFGISLEGHFR